ncbi:hypothetical protein cypCar_00045924 [Cyprinus carpio]|nr:hypothetical protein cypCar_00045924 [Cyprinus carpio]
MVLLFCIIYILIQSIYEITQSFRFQQGSYAVEVRLNDYLDIVCPHYPLGEVPSQDAERYVLYMVEREDYDSCRPQSYDQMRWECGHPFAPHAPEKFSEKFQRFTPFTLGKEFRQGESYYYISKPLHHHGQECLRLRVDVVANDDDPVVALPEVQKSMRTNSAISIASWTVLTTLLPILLLLVLQ